VPNRPTVHPSLGMEYLFSRWTNFHDIYIGELYEKLSNLFSFSSDRINVTTNLPKGLCVSVRASLNIDWREGYSEQNS
jgi:hypothetical protein